MDKKVKFSQRIVSMGVDYLSICVVAIPISMVYFVLKGINQKIFLIFEITFLLTLWVCKDLIGGRSLGKRIKGHTLCGINNSNSVWKFILRNVFTCVWMIEIVFCLINPSRRLGDLLLGTQIIYANKDKSNLISFNKQDIFFGFIITFFILLIVILAFDLIIIQNGNPMVKLLYS